MDPGLFAAERYGTWALVADRGSIADSGRPSEFAVARGPCAPTTPCRHPTTFFSRDTSHKRKAILSARLSVHRNALQQTFTLPGPRPTRSSELSPPGSTVTRRLSKGPSSQQRAISILFRFRRSHRSKGYHHSESNVVSRRYSFTGPPGSGHHERDGE